MDCVIQIELDDGRTMAANIRARGGEDARRKTDFLCFDLQQRTGLEVIGWHIRGSCRAPKYGYTTVNTKTGNIGGAKLFQLVFTTEYSG